MTVRGQHGSGVPRELIRGRRGSFLGATRSQTSCCSRDELSSSPDAASMHATGTTHGWLALPPPCTKYIPSHVRVALTPRRTRTARRPRRRAASHRPYAGVMDDSPLSLSRTCTRRLRSLRNCVVHRQPGVEARACRKGASSTGTTEDEEKLRVDGIHEGAWGKGGFDSSRRYCAPHVDLTPSARLHVRSWCWGIFAALDREGVRLCLLSGMQKERGRQQSCGHLQDAGFPSRMFQELRVDDLSVGCWISTRRLVLPSRDQSLPPVHLPKQNIQPV